MGVPMLEVQPDRRIAIFWRCLIDEGSEGGASRTSSRIPDSEQVTWLVLDDNYLPVPPIQSYLRYLESLERSPNTIHAYAGHLKLQAGIFG
jgi:hypothetical protein